jgi:single-strand DNA-binding protein
MNVVVLIGRVVADPELKYTPSGIAVCQLRIAVDRRFKNESGERETDFFDVVAWRQSAEFAANYLTKGRLIAVHGRLQSRSWVQQDGQRRSKVEVIADNIQGLDRPKDSMAQDTVSMSELGYGPSESTTLMPEPDLDAEDNYDPFADE